MTIQRRAIALLAAGIAVTVVAAPARAVAPDQLYKMLTPSVWRVVSYDKDDKKFATGSAVVIAPEILLTNCHVIKGAKSLVIVQDNVLVTAHLRYADPVRDMCQLVARNLKAPAVRMGDSDRLVGGQRIYTLGNPLGQELTLSEGLVSALRRDESQRLAMIQISAPISPGSSGGGLFDEEGRLVGITTAGFDKGQNMNLAIPIRWLQELVARSRAFYAGDAAAVRAADLPRADGLPTQPRPAPGYAAAGAAPAQGYAPAAGGIL